LKLISVIVARCILQGLKFRDRFTDKRYVANRDHTAPGVKVFSRSSLFPRRRSEL